MHVLVLCEYGTVSGGERSLLAALPHCPADVRVSVLAPRLGRLQMAIHAARAAHVPFDVRGPSGVRLATTEVVEALAPLVEQLRADVVHANSLSMGRITGILSSRIGAACTAHLRDIVGVSRRGVRELNGNVKLVAVSQATRDFHVAQGLDPARLVVIYNGIDCPQWRPQGTGRELPGSLDLPPEAFLAATIGQIGIRKGLDVLVEAAIRLADDLPHLHYVVAGERFSTKAESISFERSLHDRLSEANIAGRFHWLGYRTDVERILGNVDLLIHPARQEPFGRVLLEAAACGLPIVATDVGGTAEMLERGKSALLVPPHDPEALAEAVRRLVANPQQRRRLGESARRRIAQRFDIRQRAGDLFALWREVCA